MSWPHVNTESTLFTNTITMFHNVRGSARAILFLAALTTAGLHAQTPELVKDLNPSGDGAPYAFAEANGLLFFGATDPVAGQELWRTDGTSTGTQLVKDIRPGGSATPLNLVSYDGRVYFRANDGTHGEEVWMSDGTDAGTVLLKDIRPGADGGGFGNGVVYGGLLYFTANDGTGTEWWTTDGTSTGTLAFTNTAGGSAGSPFVHGGLLYFQYSDGVTGPELWRTDGTPGGTVLVKDINTTTPAGSQPQQFASYNGLLYFSADDAIHGRELWVTDGSEAGTTLVKDIHPTLGGDPRYFTELNGLLYFGASDGVSGWELWVTDGTQTGTTLVKDINPTGNADLLHLTLYDGQLFFSANDGSHGREPWISDGSATGTVMLKDIAPNSGSQTGFFQFYFAPREFNGLLHFVADAGSNGWELWRTDGTEAGTVLVEPVGATGSSPLDGTADFALYNGGRYFKAGFTAEGRELWRLADGGTGLPEVVVGEGLRVWPVPAQDHVTVQLPLGRGTVSLQLLDAQGRVVRTVRLAAAQAPVHIDLGGLAPGVYLLRAGPDGPAARLVVER